MPTRLRVLLVEDSPDDATLIIRELIRCGFEPDLRRVEDADELRAALAEGAWDVVLSDFTLPGFGASAALALCRESDPELPFIVVSGTIGEEKAVDVMRAGASDYLLKGSLIRLAPAIERELREAGNRRAHRRAEQTAYRLAALVESSTDAIVSETVDGIVTSWNSAAERLYGWTAEEAVGRHISFLAPPDKTDELAGVLQRLRRGERVAPYETVRLRKGGARVEVSHTTSPIRDMDGRLIGWSKIARDITAQKRAEENLRVSEGRLRRFVESDMMGCFFWRKDGSVTDANDAFLSLVGYDRDDLRTGRLSWADITPPEYRSQDEACLAELAAHGRCNPFEKEYVHKDGRRVPILIGAAIVDGDEGVAFAVDLTERKRAEERQARDAMLLANVRDAVIVTDLDGVVTYWNDGAARLFGWTAAERIGRPLTDRAPEANRGPTAEAFRAILEGADFAGEWEDRRKDGSQVWIDARVSRITDTAGRVVGVLKLAHDITDRKRAELALQENEAKLAEAVRIARMGYWNRDLATGDFDWTDELYGIFGVEPEAFGRTFESFLARLHPEDRQRARERIARAEAEGGSFDHTYRIVVRGEVRVIHEVGRVIASEDGRPCRVAGAAQDVTERTKAEEALLLRDRAILAVSQGIVITGPNQPDNPILFASPGFERLTGYAQDDVLGLNCRFLQGPATDPDAVSRIKEAIRAGRPCTTELLNYRKDGSAFWNELSVSPVRDDRGRVTHFVGVQTDVSERRKLQEERDRLLHRLQLHLERMPLACMFFDTEMRIQEWNPAAEHIFGYSRDEIIGRAAFETIVPESAHSDVEAIARWVKNGELAANNINENRTKDGRIILCEWFNTPFANPTGEVVGRLSLAQDITDKRSLEHQLRHAQKMEAVGQLAGGIAHDFNNLLTIIRGYSELLLQEMPPGDPSWSRVEEIRRAGERSAALTRQLLVFSRKQVVAPKVLDINEVVADAEKLLRRVLGEDVQFQTALRPLGGCVKADAGQLEQVLVNLAVNARDAMPTGGKLTIETADAELDEGYARRHAGVSPGPYILLAVSDTGTGMTQEVKARIFEPFFTTKEVGKGTGLGLAVVHGIVKEAGGHVGIESELGVGATFKIYLPRIDLPAGAGKSRSDFDPAPGGAETVLLVEDEDGVRALARHVLAGCGYEVLEAADGDEALRVAERQPGADPPAGDGRGDARPWGAEAGRAAPDPSPRDEGAVHLGLYRRCGDAAWGPGGTGPLPPEAVLAEGPGHQGPRGARSALNPRATGARRLQA